MKNLLKVKRWEAGIKQYELAMLLGCSSTYLSMVENGRIEPTEKFKLKVARVFDVPESDIFLERHDVASMIKEKAMADSV
ncbi:MAG: helix-turn-helix transcriptional regulator [candidate division KSB1 bacterium]|nr:helix-turn-helix transcriptional regulator [candidate division KSB1 bacterium]